MLMFLEARHLFSRFIVPFFSKKKRGVFSNFFSNMKAYVIVRGSVANIRNIVAMRSDQKLFAFTVANDLVLVLIDYSDNLCFG